MFGTWFKFDENGTFAFHNSKGVGGTNSYCVWNEIEPLAGHLMFMLWVSNGFSSSIFRS